MTSALCNWRGRVSRFDAARHPFTGVISLFIEQFQPARESGTARGVLRPFSASERL
jgi:hypothetical protein